jgi:endoglucanase
LLVVSVTSLSDGARPARPLPPVEGVDLRIRPGDRERPGGGTLAAGNWCNPPGSGLGLRPTANTGAPLLDAYLWVKTPGQSDGQCDSAAGVRAWDYSDYSQPGWPATAAARALFDPLGGIDDPAAGAWFSQQALQLA